MTAASDHRPQSRRFLFRVENDQYHPGPLALGYWKADSLNGSALSGLLAHALESEFAECDFVPARFGVDLLEMAAAQPLTVETRLVRGGSRLRLAEATIVQDGRAMARGTVQFLRQTAQPSRPTWQSPPWKAPPPGEIVDFENRKMWLLKAIPACHASVERACPAQAGRASSGILGQVARLQDRQVWINPDCGIVENLPPTPFTRLALVSDYASPLANSSETGIDFVNADFTTYIHRLPVGPWIGIEAIGHGSQAGVAIGECWVHDKQGRIGTINVSAICQTRKDPE